MAELAEVGREISATLDLEGLLERIAERAQALLEADTSAVFLAEPDGAVVPGHRGGRRERRARSRRIASCSARESSGRRRQSGAPEVVNDAAHDPRSVPIPGVADDASTRKNA